MTIYLTLQDLKRLIVDLESVANNALTPSKNYPMTATISVGATKTNNKDKTRLCLFLDLLDKHGEVWCSGAWNLENKEQETIQEQLEKAIISFIKEADPNRD
ncbi:hypothetical protein BB387_01280 [Helicobacter pylori]|uniref:hypothetical protein n=1 Tax=Helicobacter pylori TaxID=210 RepID=UPI000BE901E9|nr:hypothetical protein [Helicobacter pylori]PDW14106.1 hypothetical protein BB387_01280 [Helicobacter pylori]